MSDLNVPSSVRAAVQAARWPGVVLPRMRLGGYRVYPVVDIDPNIWADRIRNGHGPELDGSTLAIWEGWAPDLGPMPPRTPLAIVGLVSDVRPQAALNALRFLSGVGGGLIVSTGRRGPTTVTLMECDVAEVGVVWVPPNEDARVLVQGRFGPVATARRIVLTRHDEELFFQWALTTGVTVH